MLAVGLNATKGDITKKDDISRAITAAKIDSPRGPFTISRAHNPVQDFYLRQVVGKENKVIGVASKSLADPARGCNLQ
jgi:branched-chain amino acid transport system substrate-binding protein